MLDWGDEGQCGRLGHLSIHILLLQKKEEKTPTLLKYSYNVSVNERFLNNQIKRESVKKKGLIIEISITVN